VARGFGGRALLAGVLLAVISTAIPATAGGAAGTTTADVPTRKDVTSTVIRTSTADTLVQVNVDIGMQVKAGTRCRSDLPGVCKGGGTVYHPCFNLKDPAYAGCQMYTLYRVLPRGTAADLARGIAITNTGTARDGTPVEHGWAGKVTQADLEFYAYDPLGRYGDARMRVPGFPHRVLDVAHSDEIGHVVLPQLGAADAGVLVGRAVGKDGRPMPPGSFKLDLFGHGDTGHPTGLLKGKRFMLYGFGGAKVMAGVTDGSFRSKPLWVGHYDLHIQRKGASYRCKLVVKPGEVRFDVHFGKKNLGQRCTPMNSLAQGVPG
jgi:hypothetical protein